MSRAVLWDLDGVLVDTTAFHFQAWREFMGELGRPLSEQDFRRTFGLRNDAILKELLGDIAPAEVERLSRRKEELFRERAKGRITPVPGAVELARRLERRGTRMGLVSSTPRENIELIVGELGLEGFFQAIVAAEDTERGKPDPEGFLLGAERLGVSPQDCVVIEDAPGGVEAARRAGMRCVGLATTRPREALAEADLVVDSLTEAALASFLEG